MWVSYVAGQVVSFVFTLFRLIPLAWANRVGGARIPAEGDVVVSLTTHGRRLASAFYAVESVARGSRPAPIVLWLDPEDYDGPWPPSLKRLVDRGLQVRRGSGNLGPHAKYFDMFRALAGTDTRVVTVDDDIIYPEWFLEKLLEVGGLRPDTVVAYRAHRVELRDGRLLPYMRWTAADTCRASVLHFATGVSGVCYAPAFVDYVAARGEEFRGVAPRADDVWLHLCALRSGFRVRQVFAKPRNFAIVPLTQRGALVRRNGPGGGNDAQIARAYTIDDVAVLAAAAAAED